MPIFVLRIPSTKLTIIWNSMEATPGEITEILTECGGSIGAHGVWLALNDFLLLWILAQNARETLLGWLQEKQNEDTQAWEGGMQFLLSVNFVLVPTFHVLYCTWGGNFGAFAFVLGFHRAFKVAQLAHI